MTTPEEAVAFLAFTLGWEGGELPVYVDGHALPQFKVPCAPSTDGRLWARAQRLDLERSAEVAVGLPSHNGSISHSTVLWCWVTGSLQLRHAVRFSPAPNLVLRMGSSSRRLLVWSMKEAVPWVSVEPANKKLAYCLRAPQNVALPEKLRVPLPGTFLRVGRVRPVPVLVTKMELTAYSRQAVVGRLRDPPPSRFQLIREGKVSR